MTSHRLQSSAIALALSLALSPLTGVNAHAQTSPAAPTFDESFAQARNWATSGQREQAIALYTKLLQDSPGNSDVLLGRGRTYAWMGQYDKAEPDLVAVTVASPTYADAWSALGDMYLWSDRPQQARAAYAQWQQLEPGNAAAAQAVSKADRALQPVSQQVASNNAGARDDFGWSASAGFERTSFSPSTRTAWNESSIGVRKHFARGSIALEGLRADRFGTHSTAWAIDAYAPLWSGAYANLRYQDGKDLYPDTAWRAEVFQGVTGGWELSAGIDQLRFSDTTTIYSAGLGRYWGNYYARYKLRHSDGSGSGSWGHRAQLRWYYAGNADDYAELSAGYGRSVEDSFGGVDRVSTTSSRSLGASWVKYPTRNLGFKLGVGFANNVDGYDERSVSVGIFTRW